MSTIRIAPRARTQVREAWRWWREHGGDVDAFRAAVSSAYTTLVAYPEIGRLIDTRLDARGRNIRRLYLPRVRYHVYYSVAAEQVEVLAFWHERRSPPKL